MGTFTSHEHIYTLYIHLMSDKQHYWLNGNLYTESQVDMLLSSSQRLYSSHLNFEHNDNYFPKKEKNIRNSCAL